MNFDIINININIIDITQKESDALAIRKSYVKTVGSKHGLHIAKSGVC